MRTADGDIERLARLPQRQLQNDGRPPKYAEVGPRPPAYEMTFINSSSTRGRVYLQSTNLGSHPETLFDEDDDSPPITPDREAIWIMSPGDGDEGLELTDNISIQTT